LQVATIELRDSYIFRVLIAFEINETDQMPLVKPIVTVAFGPALAGCKRDVATEPVNTVVAGFRFIYAWQTDLVVRKP
jgi:hypothetical protein